MKDGGINSNGGEVLLFRTSDEDWRVMDCSRQMSEYDEMVYWGPSLKEAMQHFGWLTARKSPKALAEAFVGAMSE